jgi:hypothetical protein
MTPLNAWLSIVGQPTIYILFYVSFVAEQQRDAFGRSFSLFLVNPISISHPCTKRKENKKEKEEGVLGFRARSRQTRYAESAWTAGFCKGH